MIEVLQSLQFKTNRDLNSIGVTVNGSNLPNYNQQLVNGQYVYSKVYTPQYLEGSVNYGVSGQETSLKQIRDYSNLKVSFNPFDLQIDYLENTIYTSLPNLQIPFFNYWYDIATLYSSTTVQQEVSSKDLYRAFGDSVGYIMLFSVSPETTVATSLNSANVKAYNRTLESRILDDIRNEIDSAYQVANSSYAENLANIAIGSSSTTAHGDRLVVDQGINTKYPSASSTYVSNLFGTYKQLLYLTPLYANSTQTVSLTTAPYFNAVIGDASVVVDKLGHKVSIDQGWSEQVMLSAYNVE